MNLYSVNCSEDWQVFVFAETRNRAKMMFLDWYGDCFYIDIRARILKKDTGGIAEVVDTDWEDNYKRVTDLGFRYLTEGEVEG